jgi:hypothetical protein
MAPEPEGPAPGIARRKAQMAEQAYEMGSGIRREGTSGSASETAGVGNADGHAREFIGQTRGCLPQPVLA